MKKHEFDIILDEATQVSNYALSSRAHPKNQSIFKERLASKQAMLYEILQSTMLDFIMIKPEEFPSYIKIRLKLALATKDFSCTELNLWVIQKIMLNPFISLDVKNDLKLLAVKFHTLIYFEKDNLILSPFSKFTTYNKVFFGSIEEYIQFIKGKTKYEAVPISDLNFLKTFAIESTQLAKLDFNSGYDIRTLLQWNTVPQELKNCVDAIYQRRQSQPAAARWLAGV